MPLSKIPSKLVSIIIWSSGSSRVIVLLNGTFKLNHSWFPIVLVEIESPLMGSINELYLTARLISLSKVVEYEINPSWLLLSSSKVAGGDTVCQFPISSPVQSEFGSDESNE